MPTVREVKADLRAALESLEKFDDDMPCRIAWWVGEGDRMTGAYLISDPKQGGPVVEVG